MSTCGSSEVFAAGDFRLQSGLTLPDTRLAYDVFGTLNESGDNAIIYPTRFRGTRAMNRYLIGKGMALDPSRYFIVVPALLGNGESSSPSNVAAEIGGDRFPLTTIYDNVRLQHQLLTEHLGVTRLALAVGWSMGGQQAYEWAAQHAEMVDHLAVICGAARTAPHTRVFVDGVKAAVTSDPEWNRPGGYPKEGFRTLGKVWAGWGLSQTWYREHGYRALGYSTLDEYLDGYWGEIYLQASAPNMVAMMHTWQAHDISANERFQGDYEMAMRHISAPAVIMPGRTDLYFPPEDSALEVPLLRNGRLAVIESVWGHYAGGGVHQSDTEFIDANLKELLAT